MSEIVHYEVEFVRRTKENLQNYHGENKLTNAINCALGLIILPNEIIRERPRPIWDTDISQIRELSTIKPQMFTPIQRIRRNGVIDYYPTSLKVLLKKIRDGLAHQHIEPVNNNGKFTGIVIRNYFPPGRNHQDLEIEFSRRELENFAFFIADMYIDTMNA